jgi:cell division protein DivIC
MANNNPLQPFLDKVPGPLKNRYFLVLTAFLAWMIFFDKHDLLTEWRLQQTVNKLEADKLYYIEQIQEAKQQRLEQEINKEKFARERYFMKKQGEDVFIIVEDEE